MREPSLPLDEAVCGDAFEVLKGFPEESVDMVMFSPPYWGLRDYKVPKVDGVFAVGGLGLEEHPKQYVARMVVLGRLLKRVLKKAGSMWLNMGDTFYGGGQGQEITSHGKMTEGEFLSAVKAKEQIPNKFQSNWLQPKQKLLLPERVAIALQEDGWILRNDVVWHKPNHMPSSVKDRLTTSWEHLYFFVRSRRYFFDLDAIRQPHKLSSIERDKKGYKESPMKGRYQVPWEKREGTQDQQFLNPLGKAPDDTVSYEGKFDGFAEESEQGSPRARNERQLKQDNVPNPHTNNRLYQGFNKRWKEKHGRNNPHRMRDNPENYVALDSSRPNDFSHPLGKNPSDTIEAIKERIGDAHLGEATANLYRPHKTHHELGKNPEDFWSITTQPFKEAHFAVYPERLCVMPIKAACPQNGTVLDPMCGSGTTLLVARKLCRHYIGIELNPSYVEMAKERLAEMPERIDTLLMEASEK